MVVIYQSLIETGQAADADVAQSVVRRIGSAEVTGPIPVISSKKTPGDILRVFFISVGEDPTEGDRCVTVFLLTWLHLNDN